MNYEVVSLEQKTVVGFADVTNNSAPDMSAKIGGLWQKFYSGTAQTLKNRTNQKAIGLYWDYKQNGDYTVLACAEVSAINNAELPDDITIKTIPAGNYAKFTVKGDMVQAVANAWGEIWQTPLDRTFTGDFEEYQEDTATGNGTIIIYVAIK